MTSRNKSPAVGIHIGMENLYVGVSKKWRIVKDILDDNGDDAFPAYVAFTENGRLVGYDAKEQIDMNPTNTVYDICKMIGRPFSHLCIQSGIKQWPFKVVAGSDDKVNVVVKYNNTEKQFSVEELFSILLEKIKERVETFQEGMKDVVITVPIYFDDMQRSAIKEACTIASIDVLQIIDVPIAVSIAYELGALFLGFQLHYSIIIFHLRDRSFDVSAVEVSKRKIELKAIVGDSHLGGENFTDRMVEYCIKEFRREHNIDITSNAKSLMRLKNACEKAKRALSVEEITRVEINGLYDGIDFSCEISQSLFEDLNMDLFTKCMDLTEKCMSDANIEKKDTYGIIPVGGSTKIPKIQTLLHDLNGNEGYILRDNWDRYAPYGATVHALNLHKKLKLEILSYSRPIYKFEETEHLLIGQKELQAQVEKEHQKKSSDKLEEIEPLLMKEKALQPPEEKEPQKESPDKLEKIFDLLAKKGKNENIQEEMTDDELNIIVELQAKNRKLHEELAQCQLKLEEEKEKRKDLETQMKGKLEEPQNRLKENIKELQKENKKLKKEIRQYELSYEKIFATQYEFYDCEDSDDDQALPSDQTT